MKRNRAYRLRLLFGVIALALFTGPFMISGIARTGEQRSNRPKTVSRVPRVTELRDINQLKEIFLRDSGKVRLVALLSPT